MKTLWQKKKIARFQQFLLLSLCFKKLSAAEASESVYMRERVNDSAADIFKDNLWQKVKLLIMSNSSHYNNVFNYIFNNSTFKLHRFFFTFLTLFYVEKV